MSLHARTAALERTLSPTEATLLWLADAHRCRTLPAYLDQLIDDPRGTGPLDSVARHAVGSVTGRVARRYGESLDGARRIAARDAIFLVELVLGLEDTLETAIATGSLRWLALDAQLDALVAEARFSGQTTAPGRRVPDRRAAWRGMTSQWLTEAYALDEARRLLEWRYLRGTTALFPATAEGWDGLLLAYEGLGERASARGGTAGGDIDVPALRRAARDRARAVAATIVSDARLATLEYLGLTTDALALAERHLRPPDEPTAQPASPRRFRRSKGRASRTTARER
jgi:hypothetical protein